MKKLITMLVLAITVSVSFANITNDIANATQLMLAKDNTNAITAYEQIIVDYPDAPANLIADVKFKIGYCEWRRGEYTKAQTAFEKVIILNSDGINNILANAQYMLGMSLLKQNKKSEAMTALITSATDYGFINLAHQKKVYTQIDWVVLGKDASIAYLEKLLLIVPAVEANTEFLGQVKSKLEVLK